MHRHGKMFVEILLSFLCA